MKKPRHWGRSWDTNTLSNLGAHPDLASFWKSNETTWKFQAYVGPREAVVSKIKRLRMDAEISWGRPSCLPYHKRKNTCKVLILTKTLTQPRTREEMIKLERAAVEPPLRKRLKELKAFSVPVVKKKLQPINSESSCAKPNNSVILTKPVRILCVTSVMIKVSLTEYQ